MTWEGHLFNLTGEVLSLSADRLTHGSFTTSPPDTIAAGADAVLVCDSNVVGQIAGSVTYIGTTGGATFTWDIPTFGQQTNTSTPSGSYTTRIGANPDGLTGGAMFFVDLAAKAVTVPVAPSSTDGLKAAVVTPPAGMAAGQIPSVDTPVDPANLFDTLKKLFPGAPREFLICLVGHGAAEQGYTKGVIACMCWNYMGFEGDWHQPWAYGSISVTLSVETYESILNGTYTGTEVYKDRGNNAGWGTGADQLAAVKAGTCKLFRNGKPRIWQYARRKRPAWTVLDGAATEHGNWLIRRIKALKDKAQAAEKSAAGSGATWSTLADDTYRGNETAYANALVVEGLLKYNSEVRDYAGKVAKAIVQMRALLKDHP